MSFKKCKLGLELTTYLAFLQFLKAFQTFTLPFTVCLPIAHFNFVISEGIFCNFTVFKKHFKIEHLFFSWSIVSGIWMLDPSWLIRFSTMPPPTHSQGNETFFTVMLFSHLIYVTFVASFWSSPFPTYFTFKDVLHFIGFELLNKLKRKKSF